MAKNNNSKDDDRDTRSPGVVTTSPSFTFTQTVTSGSAFGGSRPVQAHTAPRVDPVRTASYNPSASPGRVVAPPSNGVPQSLSEQSSGSYGDYYDDPRVLVGDLPQAEQARQIRRMSGLKISAKGTNYPKTTAKAAANTQPGRKVVPKNAVKVERKSTATKEPVQGKSTSPASSPKARDTMTCKARPTDNRPKGGGGGKKRGFIPWC